MYHTSGNGSWLNNHIFSWELNDAAWHTNRFFSPLMPVRQFIMVEHFLPQWLGYPNNNTGGKLFKSKQTNKQTFLKANKPTNKNYLPHSKLTENWRQFTEQLNTFTYAHKGTYLTTSSPTLVHQPCYHRKAAHQLLNHLPPKQYFSPVACSLCEGTWSARWSKREEGCITVQPCKLNCINV